MCVCVCVLGMEEAGNQGWVLPGQKLVGRCWKPVLSCSYLGSWLVHEKVSFSTHMLIPSPTGFILFPLWVEFFADALLCPNCGTDFLLRVSPSGNVQTCPLFLLAKLLGTVFAEL